jgi:putative IMPACT (imprinted ancient) family translation regulator
MKQKTAIRQLIEQLKPLLEDEKFSQAFKGGVYSAIRKAESLEPVNEQQIKDACEFGKRSMNKNIRSESYVTTSQYFNETFEKP